MKTFACFLLFAALVATACAYPASSESKSSSRDLSDDAEFIVVPLEHQKPSYFNRYPSSFDDFDGVVDTGEFPHPGQNPVFFPSINPFTWHFSSYLDDLIKRVRDRFAGSWNPFYGGGDFVPSGPGLWPIDIPDDSSEPAEKNATSTVNIINGHKVIVNDTYYTKKTDYGTSIFKVRVIDVKPLDGDEDSKPTDGGEESKPSDEGTVETGNRTGADDGETTKDDSDDKKDAPTEAPKRDTELDSSDEETTAANENLNTIDTNSDVDSPKKEEVNTEPSSEAADKEDTPTPAVLSTTVATPEE